MNGGALSGVDRASYPTVATRARFNIKDSFDQQGSDSLVEAYLLAIVRNDRDQ